jgi:hypothetical protein
MAQKTIITIALSLLFICSCNNRKDNEQLVYDYFTALNNGDFKEVINCVSDSITLTKGDFILTSSIKDLHTHFQWDLVFKPHYKVIFLIHVLVKNAIKHSKRKRCIIWI